VVIEIQDRSNVFFLTFQDAPQAYSTAEVKTFDVSLGKTVKFKGVSINVYDDLAIPLAFPLLISKTDDSFLSIGDEINNVRLRLKNDAGPQDVGWTMMVFG